MAELEMVSSEYAVRKPNPLIFETAAARLAVPPEHVWVVGDRLDTDVAGAKAVGMTAVWFQPGGPERLPSHEADLVTFHWDDVVERIRQTISKGRAAGH